MIESFVGLFLIIELAVLINWNSAGKALTAGYSVQSSTGHLTYTVRYRDEDGWSCTCPSFTYHQGYCKHIRQVLANPNEFMND